MQIAYKRDRSANPIGDETLGGSSETFQIGICYKGAYTLLKSFRIFEIALFHPMLQEAKRRQSDDTGIFSISNA